MILMILINDAFVIAPFRSSLILKPNKIMGGGPVERSNKGSVAHNKRTNINNYKFSTIIMQKTVFKSHFGGSGTPPDLPEILFWSF